MLEQRITTEHAPGHAITGPCHHRATSSNAANAARWQGEPGLGVRLRGWRGGRAGVRRQSVLLQFLQRQGIQLSGPLQALGLLKIRQGGHRGRVELAARLSVVMTVAAQRLLDFEDALGRRRPLPTDPPPADSASPGSSPGTLVLGNRGFLAAGTFFAGFAGEALAGGAGEAEAPAASTKPARIEAKYRTTLPGIASRVLKNSNRRCQQEPHRLKPVPLLSNLRAGSGTDFSLCRGFSASS